MAVGNLKPAPLFLSVELVAKLVGDRPAYGKGVERLRIEGQLVDRPQGSEARHD